MQMYDSSNAFNSQQNSFNLAIENALNEQERIALMPTRQSRFGVFENETFFPLLSTSRWGK